MQRYEKLDMSTGLKSNEQVLEDEETSDVEVSDDDDHNDDDHIPTKQEDDQDKDKTYKEKLGEKVSLQFTGQFLENAKKAMQKRQQEVAKLNLPFWHETKR